MESLSMRKEQLSRWLTAQCGLTVTSLLPLIGDASFRRYYRVHVPGQTYIAMDAPPPEDCEPFVAVAKALKDHGLTVPHVFEQDISHGFLLLSDFGDTTLLKALQHQANPEQLYPLALASLASMQTCQSVPGRALPVFDSNVMHQEWLWHKEWFAEKWLGLELSDQESKKLEACYEAIVVSASQQPRVFMHRDYHSANLMWLASENKLAILDFQDAFMGPVTYDLVSLLRDCYISWPETQVEGWVRDYYSLLQERHLKNISAEQFQEWFDWMGVQRQLKALLTFARKKVRDHQAHYLQHVPRTIQNLMVVTARYPSLSPLHGYLRDRVMPALAEENG